MKPVLFSVALAVSVVACSNVYAGDDFNYSLYEEAVRFGSTEAGVLNWSSRKTSILYNSTFLNVVMSDRPFAPVKQRAIKLSMPGRGREQSAEATARPVQ